MPDTPGVETIHVEGPPSKFEFDHAGFFYIYLKDGLIVVEHYLNVQKGTGRDVDTGKLNKVFKGKTAIALGHAVADQGLIGRHDHAVYLGRELQKAQIALEKGLKYEQDSPLDL